VYYGLFHCFYDKICGLFLQFLKTFKVRDGSSFSNAIICPDELKSKSLIFRNVEGKLTVKFESQMIDQREDFKMI